jgi:hypothetical protein
MTNFYGAEFNGDEMIFITANGIIKNKINESSDHKIVYKEYQACKRFIENADPILKTRIVIGSYALKHVIERALGMYISNGACIMGMIKAQNGNFSMFKIKEIKGLNCSFSRRIK